MKHVTTPINLIALVLTLGLILSAPALAQREIIVDDDGVECPNLDYFTIQEAVNAAAPGDHIRVCAGYYFEQVVISKRLQIRGDNGAIVYPFNMTANTTSLATGAPVAAGILVRDTTEVSIQGLTLDTLFNGLTDCTPNLVGVFFRNASGSVSNMAVRNVYLGAGSEGCQSGLGIFVQSGNGGTSRVEITNNSVHDYQKNGITANERGTTVTISQNQTTGAGPTFGAAPNGIQIGYDAAGTIINNQAFNHVWAPCDAKTECAYIATDILVVNAAGVRVLNNVVGKSQGGVAIRANNATVDGNHVFNTDIFDGISMVGNGNTAGSNFVSNSGRAGIFVRGDRNRVQQNRINEAQAGVQIGGGTGNVISGNTIFNTITPIRQPSSPEGDTNTGNPTFVVKTPVPFR